MMSARTRRYGVVVGSWHVPTPVFLDNGTEASDDDMLQHVMAMVPSLGDTRDGTVSFVGYRKSEFLNIVYKASPQTMNRLEMDAASVMYYYLLQVRYLLLVGVKQQLAAILKEAGMEPIDANALSTRPREVMEYMRMVAAGLGKGSTGVSDEMYANLRMILQRCMLNEYLNLANILSNDYVTLMMGRPPPEGQSGYDIQDVAEIAMKSMHMFLEPISRMQRRSSGSKDYDESYAKHIYYDDEQKNGTINLALQYASGYALKKITEESVKEASRFPWTPLRSTRESIPYKEPTRNDRDLIWRMDVVLHPKKPVSNLGMVDEVPPVPITNMTFGYKVNLTNNVSFVHRPNNSWLESYLINFVDNLTALVNYMTSDSTDIARFFSFPTHVDYLKKFLSDVDDVLNVFPGDDAASKLAGNFKVDYVLSNDPGVERDDADLTGNEMEIFITRRTWNVVRVNDQVGVSHNDGSRLYDSDMINVPNSEITFNDDSVPKWTIFDNRFDPYEPAMNTDPLKSVMSNTDSDSDSDLDLMDFSDDEDDDNDNDAFGTTITGAHRDIPLLELSYPGSSDNDPRTLDRRFDDPSYDVADTIQELVLDKIPVRNRQFRIRLRYLIYETEEDLEDASGKQPVFGFEYKYMSEMQKNRLYSTQDQQSFLGTRYHSL